MRMLQIFLVLQSLHPFEKFCLWASMSAVNVSVAICQLPVRQFCSFGKSLIKEPINNITVTALRACEMCYQSEASN